MSNQLYINIVRVEVLGIDGSGEKECSYGFEIWDDYDHLTQTPYESWEEMLGALGSYSGPPQLRILALLLDEQAFPYRTDRIYDLIDFHRSAGKSICIAGEWYDPWKELEGVSESVSK